MPGRAQLRPSRGIGQCYLDRHRPPARVGLRDRPREALALLFQQRKGFRLQRRRRHGLGLGRRAAGPEGLDAAAGDDHKNPEAVAEAKAKITEEAEKAQREEEKKADEEDKVPKYVLTKYERIEREAVRKSHRASDAIDATLSP